MMMMIIIIIIIITVFLLLHVKIETFNGWFSLAKNCLRKPWKQ
jgi:hypothetical membrane protein